MAINKEPETFSAELQTRRVAAFVQISDVYRDHGSSKQHTKNRFTLPRPRANLPVCVYGWQVVFPYTREKYAGTLCNACECRDRA